MHSNLTNCQLLSAAGVKAYMVAVAFMFVADYVVYHFQHCCLRPKTIVDTAMRPVNVQAVVFQAGACALVGCACAYMGLPVPVSALAGLLAMATVDGKMLELTQEVGVEDEGCFASARRVFTRWLFPHRQKAEWSNVPDSVPNDMCCFAARRVNV